MLFADILQPSFWNAPSGSAALFIKLFVALIVTIGFCVLLAQAGPQARKWIVGGFTFVAGSFYVIAYLWPEPINRQPAEKPNCFVETVSFFIGDATPIVGNFSNILSAFLIGLGVYSLVRIHSIKISRFQKDWQYSLVLLSSASAMAVFGFWDWSIRKFGPNSASMDDQKVWLWPNFVYNFLFDGLFQQMDAAMFSLIAFYILSAAYRAFRVRTIEATILLATALIFMLSFLGLVAEGWHGLTQHLPGGENWSLGEIQKWVQSTIQKPALRAIDFGVGLGALAMGLRIWLSLERQGNS